MTNERVTTGIKGFDEMLGGGFLPNSMVLVRGAPGAGKTSLALQFLLHGATQCDEPGLLISFEEFPSSLHRDAESLGWSLSALEASGNLHLMFTSPAVFLASLESPDSRLNQLILNANIRRLALDSISHFDRLTNDEQDLRHIYTSVVNGLRREGITALLLGEEGRADHRRTSKGGISFIVDAIVMLRYVEIESAMQRAIVVLKMRGSNHAKEIRRYEIGSGGLTIMDVFEGREGLLNGASYRSLS
ncbi:MAG: ATPase domain-containing protein [Chloroflexota bacterium]|nr:ATPase domain-containing protein [Chloroflexota bacterium]